MSKVQTGRVDSCKAVTVTRIEFIRGTGVEGDPVRTVVQWWTPEGEMIAESDSFAEDEMQVLKSMPFGPEFCAKTEQAYTKEREKVAELQAQLDAAREQAKIMRYALDRLEREVAEISAMRALALANEKKEIQVAHNAALLIGTIRPGMTLAATDFEFICGKLRALDLAPILAKEIAPYYERMKKERAAKKAQECTRCHGSGRCNDPDSLGTNCLRCGGIGAEPEASPAIDAYDAAALKVRENLRQRAVREWQPPPVSQPDCMCVERPSIADPYNSFYAQPGCPDCGGSGYMRKGVARPTPLSDNLAAVLDIYEFGPGPGGISGIAREPETVDASKPLRLLAEVVKLKDEKHGVGKWSCGGLVDIDCAPLAGMDVRDLPPMPAMWFLCDVFAQVRSKPLAEGSVRSAIIAVLRACGLEPVE